MRTLFYVSTLSLALASLAAPLVAADSAYITSEGRFDTSLTASTSSYDTFFLGETKLSNKDAFGSDEKVTQNTVTLAVRYGITSRVGVDLSVGQTAVNFRPQTEKVGGLDDTRIGITSVLVSEFDDVGVDYHLPTISMRIGGIIKGTYDSGADVVGPSAPGLGENGAEAALLFGKYFADIGFGLNASVGFKHYSGEVPGRLLWSAGAYQSVVDQVVLSGQITSERSGSGPDIGGPGFTGDFKAVREEDTQGELSVTYTGLTDTQVGVFGAKCLSFGNRNVGNATTLGIFVGHLF